MRPTVQAISVGISNKLFNKSDSTRRPGLRGESTTGLFIAKQTVKLYGGAIWPGSREQEGTAFFIELA